VNSKSHLGSGVHYHTWLIKFVKLSTCEKNQSSSSILFSFLNSPILFIYLLQVIILLFPYYQPKIFKEAFEFPYWINTMNAEILAIDAKKIMGLDRVSYFNNPH